MVQYNMLTPVVRRVLSHKLDIYEFISIYIYTNEPHTTQLTY